MFLKIKGNEYEFLDFHKGTTLEELVSNLER